MARLEDLTRGAHVRGLRPEGPVEVLDVKWHGTSILEAKKGKVRLLLRDEMAADWSPATDRRLTVWELTQHLIRRLEAAGESAAADLLRQVGSLGDVARDLAYRLYSLCERKGWAQDALAYNGLVTAWPELTRLASQAPVVGEAQRSRSCGCESRYTRVGTRSWCGCSSKRG